MSACAYHHICIFFLCALFAIEFRMTASLSVKLKLIHPELVLKSYLNHNATELQHVRRTAHSSMERYKYLSSKTIESSNNEGIQTRLDANFNSFYVNFSIGEPPVWQIVAVDSGSHLLWIPCHPCSTCNSQSNPLYNPIKSSTYTSISCDSHYCGELGNCTIDRNNCPYSVKYGDRSTSKGELKLEQIKFWSTLNDGMTTFSNIMFGCGHSNKGLGMDKGILGLGTHRLSLVSQLGTRFSYCIGDLHNIDYEHNQLIIGEYANMEGASTPLETDYRGLYYVTLEGISVGDKRLDIDKNLFKRKTAQDGIIIDSGTTITYLARSAYYKLAEEVQKLLDGQVQRVFYLYRQNGICYKGKISDQLIGFPTVTFHFAGEDADFFVENEGMFRQYEENIFCLAVEPVLDTRLSVIGIFAQQYYNIGYDLKSMKLYFENIDCELLE